MKRNLFLGIVTAALLVVFAGCSNEVEGNVGINAERPAAPSGVTATANTARNAIIVNWTGVANANGYEVVIQQVDRNNILTADGDSWLNYQLRPRSGVATVSWNEDQLEWNATRNDNADSWIAVVNSHAGIAGQFRVGVITTGIFNAPWATNAPSDITWAEGTFTFTRWAQ